MSLHAIDTTTPVATSHTCAWLHPCQRFLTAENFKPKSRQMEVGIHFFWLIKFVEVVNSASGYGVSPPIRVFCESSNKIWGE